MAKLNNSPLKKIDLEDITLKSNVRRNYTNIEELAGSIERDGQILPVAVCKDDNGDYILIAGYRRFKAHEYLVSTGKPFNQIEAIVKTGDYDILQLIENIQREDLNPKDLEAGLRKMVDSGLSQKEIANRLNKSPQWVSGGLKAEQTRSFLESNGVDTEKVSTAGLEKASRVPKEKQAEVIKIATENGGTVKAIQNAIKKTVPEVDPFKGLKREVSKLKKEYSLDYIVEMVKTL